MNHLLMYGVDDVMEQQDVAQAVAEELINEEMYAQGPEQDRIYVGSGDEETWN